LSPTWNNHEEWENQQFAEAVAHDRRTGSHASLPAFVAVMSVPAALGLLAATQTINSGEALIGFAIWLLLAFLLSEALQRLRRWE
jgi:hypothetical protein